MSLFFACGNKDADTASDVDFENGEAIFSTTCAACHPANGDILVLATDLSDEELTDIITNGSGGMPAQSSLSPSDVADVVAYIRRTQ